ncbi:MAG: hypothetical protein OEY17_04260 [Nitrosopumilus sp.]|nr:hypothetical protein [Nitrosopumilus sp.]
MSRQVFKIFSAWQEIPLDPITATIFVQKCLTPMIQHIRKQEQIIRVGWQYC